MNGMCSKEQRVKPIPIARSTSETKNDTNQILRLNSLLSVCICVGACELYDFMYFGCCFCCVFFFGSLYLFLFLTLSVSVSISCSNCPSSSLSPFLFDQFDLTLVIVFWFWLRVYRCFVCLDYTFFGASANRLVNWSSSVIAHLMQWTRDSTQSEHSIYRTHNYKCDYKLSWMAAQHSTQKHRNT